MGDWLWGQGKEGNGQGTCRESDAQVNLILRLEVVQSFRFYQKKDHLA